MSIHYSRGFGGYQPGGCACTKLRWLGPNPRTAALLAALWGTAALLVGALGIRAFLTLLDSPALSSDVPVLAAVQLSLSLMVVITAIVAIRVDCSRDPDWPYVLCDPRQQVGVSTVAGSLTERASRAAWIVWKFYYFFSFSTF